MIKNKKNGFTLVELIATIALLAILSVVILLNMVGLKTTEDNKNIKRYEKQVEEAACAYIDMIDNNSRRTNCKNNGCTITVYLRELIRSDIALIDPEEVDPYTNMKSESEGNCVYVDISWVQKSAYKEKVCQMKRGASCR